MKPDHALLAEYPRRGWSTVPIATGEKGPRIKDWQTRAFGPADFPAGGNIGVILGRRSGELVDIDLDCAEALVLADTYLPPTQAEFGRVSKLRSHRLYVAPGASYESFADPLLDGKNTILELRADGADGGAHQTLLPPSVTDDERREWHGHTIAPAVVAAVALRTSVAWLAIGVLAMRHVGEKAPRNPGPDLPNLLWEADRALGRRAYDWLGLPYPDAPRRYPRPRRDMSQAELDLAELVAKIPNDCDWHEWNAVGMAIFALDASDQGLIVFDDFSAKSAKYDPRSVQERWRNYRRSPPRRTGIGKLVALSAGGCPSARQRAVL